MLDRGDDLVVRPSSALNQASRVTLLAANPQGFSARRREPIRCKRADSVSRMNTNVCGQGGACELNAAFTAVSLHRSGSRFERETNEASGALSKASRAQGDASCAFQNAVSERASQGGRLRPTGSARNGAGSSYAIQTVSLSSHSHRSTHLQPRAPDSQSQQWLSRSRSTVRPW